MLTVVRTFVLVLASGWLAAPAFATEAAAPIAEFVGTYEGRSITGGNDRLEIRDLGVTIKARDRGFSVTWKTVTHRVPGEEPAHSTYSIDFEPTPRPNVYASGMRTDMFGRRVPLDPLRGDDPFVWARIHGRTLSVYALIITNDGGFEMQIYDRTLTPYGLELEFRRSRDGKEFKTLTGRLARVKT